MTISQLERPTPRSLVQSVIGQLEAAIVEGRLKPGDKLPPSHRLQADLQVSRGTLREALRVLEQKKLIEIKKGMGGRAVVRAVTTNQMSEGLAMLIRSRNVSLEHIAQFREGIEADVATAAAQRATAVQAADLQTLVEDARRHLDRGKDGWDAFVRSDEAFHLELARITGNPVYVSVLESIHANIHRYYQDHLPWKETVMRENLKDLEDIAAAVTKQQHAKAGRIAKDHVRRFNRHMQAYAG